MAKVNNQYKNALITGTSVESYQIKKVLGAGGFGITYLVVDTNLHKQFAIKEYLPHQIAVREDKTNVIPKSNNFENMYTHGIDRFLKEARNLAQFNHLNIVKVLRFFQANRTAYFVMEYVKGSDLASHLSQRHGLLDEKELLSIIHPLLEALKTIHTRKLYHRDIKPENIYMKNNRVPLLIDFGSARYDYGVASHDPTIILTPGYAPFEQYKSGRDQGPWTDLYAIGAVMYKCLFGETPPPATDRAYAMLEDLPDPYIPARKRSRGKYHETLLHSIDWALNQKVSNRPQSAKEFQSVLGEIETTSQKANQRISDREYNQAFEYKKLVEQDSSPIDSNINFDIKKNERENNVKQKDGNIDIASRGARFGAAFIDGLIFLIPTILMLMSFIKNISSLGTIGLVISVILSIIQIVLLSAEGQTMGKKALKIKIVKIETGGNGGFVTNVLIRGVVNGIISIFLIYYIVDIMFIFRKNIRCIHDLIAGTCVINDYQVESKNGS